MPVLLDPIERAADFLRLMAFAIDGVGFLVLILMIGRRDV